MHRGDLGLARRLLTMVGVVIDARAGMRGRGGGSSVIDRLSVLCFAGTYGLALLAEAARFVVRSAVRWYVAAGLMALGWLVQTAFLANLAFKNPLILVTTPFESVMLLSWIVALIGLYLMVRSPKPVAVGIFVLPIVLGLVIVAGWFAPRESDWLEWGGTIAFWGTVHGIFLLGGAVFACVAFAAGVMYLVQKRRLKAKRPSRFGLDAAESRAVGTDQPGGDHDCFSTADVRALDRHDSEPERCEGKRNRGSAGAHAAMDRSQGRERACHVAGLRGALAREVPSGDAGRSVMVLSIVAFAFLVFTWIGVDALRLPTAHGASRNSNAKRIETP